MLLKEIKLLEVDDSITDNIPSLVSAFRQGKSAGSGREATEIGSEFRKLFEVVVFTWRHGKPPLTRKGIIKYLPGGKDDQAVVEKLINTLSGTNERLKETNRIFVNKLAKALDEQLSVNAFTSTSPFYGVQKASTLLQKAEALLVETDGMQSVDSVHGEAIKRHIAANRALMFAELSKDNAATNLATNLATTASKEMKEAKSDNDRYSLIERFIATNVRFRLNCLELAKALGGLPDESEEKPEADKPEEKPPAST